MSNHGRRLWEEGSSRSQRQKYKGRQAEARSTPSGELETEADRKHRAGIGSRTDILCQPRAPHFQQPCLESRLSQDLRPLVSSPSERQRSNSRTPPGHRSHTHPLVAAQDLKATLTKDQHLGEVRNFLHRTPASQWRVTHHHRRDPPDEGCVFTARRLLIHCLALTTPAPPWGTPS